MGWQVTDTGFKIVLNAAVPEIARTAVRPALESFLAEHGLSLKDISHWIAHPGGPKVIEALEEGLDLAEGTLALSRHCLAQTGNLSSASVLFVLKETLKQKPEPGSYGLLMAMGPAFAAEFVLIRW
jgi:alkylresorcinol/alkylpyrone synthase